MSKKSVIPGIIELTSGEEFFGLENGVPVGVLVIRIRPILVVPDLNFGESVRTDIDRESIGIRIEVIVDNRFLGAVRERPVNVVDDAVAIGVALDPAGWYRIRDEVIAETIGDEVVVVDGFVPLKDAVGVGDDQGAPMLHLHSRLRLLLWWWHRPGYRRPGDRWRGARGGARDDRNGQRYNAADEECQPKTHSCLRCKTRGDTR